jgi:fatty acid desaturase
MTSHDYSIQYSAPVYTASQKLRGRIYAVVLLLINITMVAVGYFLINLHVWWGLILGLMVIGLFQYIFGFVIPHQGVHKTLFFGSFDKMISQFLLLSVGDTYKNYYKIHMNHHAFIKDPEKDPGEQQFKHWGLIGKRRAWYIWILNPLRLIFTGIEIRRIIQFFKNDAISRKQILTFWLAVCVVILMFPILIPFVAWWVLAVFTTRFWFFYISEISDHYGNDIWARNPIAGIFFWCMRGPIAWFDGYHHLHHHDGTIPWFELPRRHRATRYRNKESIIHIRF